MGLGFEALALALGRAADAVGLAEAGEEDVADTGADGSAAGAPVAELPHPAVTSSAKTAAITIGRLTRPFSPTLRPTRHGAPVTSA